MRQIFTAYDPGHHGRAKPALAEARDLSLVRAVVQYRDAHESGQGRRIQDIGLAVVISGRLGSLVRAIDLGSAELKLLNLNADLVVLAWIDESTLTQLRLFAESVVHAPAPSADRPADTEQQSLARYCFDLAVQILNQKGFTALTRATLLRIGFRDLCKDLDLHESAVIRISNAPGQITRVHLDYDSNALVFRTDLAPTTFPRQAPPPPKVVLTDAIKAAFPGLPITVGDDELANRGSSAGPPTVHRVFFGVPLNLDQARVALAQMRVGLCGLLARLEASRYSTLQQFTSAFGERDTLAHLALPPLAARHNVMDLPARRKSTPAISYAGTLRSVH